MNSIWLIILFGLSPIGSWAVVVQTNDIFAGSGVERSTFAAVPSPSTPAVALSSGVWISSGGITYSDETTRDSAAFFVNFSTLIVPSSLLEFSNSSPEGILNSTITISKRFPNTRVKTAYNCDLFAEAQTSVNIWFLQGADLISTQMQSGTPVSAIHVETNSVQRSTFSIYGELFDAADSTGALSYSLMSQASGGTAHLGDKTVCVFSAEEMWK